VLARFAGEEDQAGLVGLEAGDVEGEGFFGGVAAARVDGDADCGGEVAGDASFLQDNGISVCSPRRCSASDATPRV
jgi:hypothetical protein